MSNETEVLEGEFEIMKAFRVADFYEKYQGTDTGRVMALREKYLAGRNGVSEIERCAIVEATEIIMKERGFEP